MMENSFDEQYRYFDENFAVIRQEIAEAALKSGRNPDEVSLLAATKTVPVQVINYAISQGLTCIGENRVQELLDKYELLQLGSCDCQFIGQLQTNKVKYLVGNVSCIQSLDSMKLAEEISRQANRAGLMINTLVEVNIGREENKGGVLPEELFDFVSEAAALPGLQINGLMAIPPICEKSTELYAYFSSMHQYYVDIRAKKIDNVNMNCLSMGMSSDYKEAIACGATMVRIGSSLFGKRKLR